MLWWRELNIISNISTVIESKKAIVDQFKHLLYADTKSLDDKVSLLIDELHKMWNEVTVVNSQEETLETSSNKESKVKQLIIKEIEERKIWNWTQSVF